MKRVDRQHWDRRRHWLMVVGLSFALGALSAIVLTWRLAQSEPPPAAAMSATEAEIAALEADAAAVHDEMPAQPAVRTARAANPTATTGSDPDDSTDSDVATLRARRLEVPVKGIVRDELQDTFNDARSLGLRRHDAIDTMAPRGTPVVAVEDGRIAKLFTSVQGGLTVYMFDPSQTYSYYYAHLDRYAAGLKEGQTVRRGALIGHVGSTGNAAEDAPHLHFAIFRLTPERWWWKGTPINPYLVFK